MSTNTDHHLPFALISNLSTRCGFKRRRPVDSTEHLDVYFLDLTPLKVNVSHFVPFILPKGLTTSETLLHEHLAEFLPDLKEYAQSAYTNFVVLVVGGTLQEEERRLWTEVGVAKVAILVQPAIQAILEVEDFATKAKRLTQSLVRFLGRESLSPYLYGSPAYGGRFFGRSTIIQRVLPRVKNYTIIGNRRIGKTSVLKEVKHRLRAQNEEIITAEIYGGTCDSTLQTLHTLLENLGLFRDAEKIANDPFKIKKFPRLMHSLAKRENRPVAVFIDELDHILEFDSKQKYELLDLLRATFQNPDESSCFIYIAGFRRVMEAMVRLNTPLHNFTEKIDLTLLSREEAYEMIITPLSRLGIELTQSDLPEIIYRETGGHPELIQMHCAEIIRLYEVHGKAPDATTLITGLLNTNVYKQAVHGTFLANTNPLEALLCYLLIQAAEKSGNVYEYEFGHTQADRVLNQVKIHLDTNSIETLITNLKVTGIITQVAGQVERYKFSVPQLANYCMSIDLQFRIKKALEEVRERSMKISALATLAS